MARRKLATIEVQTGDETEPQTGSTPSTAPEGDHDPLQAELSAVDQMLADLAGADSGWIYVYRIPDRSEKEQGDEFLDRYQAADIADTGALLELLRDQWGGGRFRLRINRRGQWLGASRTVRVARRPALSAVAPVAAAPASSNTRELIDMLVAITGAVTPIVAAFAGRQPPPPVQGMTPADVVQLVKLTREGQSPLEAIRAVAELKEAIGNDEAPRGTNWLDLANNLLTQIGRISSQASPATPQLPMIPAATMPVQLPGASPTRPTSASAVTPVARPIAAPADPGHELAGLLRMIAGAAQLDRDPELYADLLLDQLGDQTVAALLSQPDPVALIAAQVPELGQYSGWMSRLLTALREAISDAGQISNDSGSVGDHAAGNGAGGAPGAAD